MQNGATATPTEREALDAYSQIVSTVAERVLPSVASLRVSRSGSPRDGGAGSGVVITPDGYLVTSAHVVAQARSASASFIDGTEYELDVVGADPLSDLAIARARAATLEAMYPGRTWLGIGSGEALNEHIVGTYWPETPERIARMFDAIEYRGFGEAVAHQQGRGATRSVAREFGLAAIGVEQADGSRLSTY